MIKKDKTIAKLVTASIFVSALMFSNKALILIGFMLLLVAALISYNKHKTRGIKNKTILLFIVILMLQQIAVSVVHGSIRDNISTIFLLFSQIFFILIITDRDKSGNVLKYTAKYFSRIIILLAIYSIIVYIFGQKYQVYDTRLGIYTQSMNIFGIKFPQSSIGGDILGTYNVGSLLKNPNLMSFYSLIAFYDIALNKTTKKTKIIGLPILLTSMLLSGSRLVIALAILLPLIIIFKKLYKNKKVKRLRGLIPLLLLIIMLLVIISGIGGEIKNIDYNGRLERWKIGIENVSLFGRGIKTDIKVLDDAKMINTSMHNSYISLAINFGIITSIIYLTIMAAAIIKSKKANKSQALIPLLLLLIVSFSESAFMFYCSFNVLIFLYLFSIINIQESRDNENQFT